MPDITIDESKGCWLWTGRTDAYGHPISTYPKSHEQRGKTFRVAHGNFEATHGYKPVRLKHTCNSPRCVNPEHLVDSVKDTATRKAESRLKPIRAEMVVLSAAIEAITSQETEDPDLLDLLEKKKRELEMLKLREEDIMSSLRSKGVTVSGDNSRT